MLALLSGFAAACMLLALPWPLKFLPSQWFTQWPGAWELLAGSALAITFGWSAWSRMFRFGTPVDRPRLRPLQLAAGLLLGLGWSGWHHLQALHARVVLPPGSEPVWFEAEVVGEPVELLAPAGRGPVIRLQVRVNGSAQSPRQIRRSPDEHPALRSGTTLRLTWNEAPAVRHGDRWRLLASVNGPWGYANPGGFDFERWLFGQGIQGSGYVRSGERIRAGSVTKISRAREVLANFIAGLELDHPAILLALLTGSRTGIGAGQWDLFRRTGTVHLMVVSGLHVGLAAVFGHLSGQLLVRLLAFVFSPLLLWVDARKAGAICGSVCCTAYLLLSGSGVPAQRAWLMALPLLLVVAWGRRIRPGPILVLAVVLLLLADPLRVHLQGFWLSIAAVALLVLAFNGLQLARRQGRSWVRDLIRSQWVIGIGLAPLLVGLTGAFSLTGFPANLLAVPLVSFAVVPLVLLGSLLVHPLPDVAALLFGLADWLTEMLLTWLIWLAEVPVLHLSVGLWQLLIAQVAGVFLILGSQRQAWPLLGLGILLCLTTSSERLPPARFRVVALDVGQGTAVLVDTARHRLLFDAGPAYPGGFETGSAVVVPSLVSTGVPAVDALVLSHDDLDHIGGAAYVRRNVTVQAVYSSFPGEDQLECHGRRWQWDGVDFRLLRVRRPAAASDNDLSCVLLVTAGDQRLLLAGDVGVAVEGHLLRLLDGPVTLMFAPHHGSASSSSRALVRVANPRNLFVSAARGNRYGHPHPEVIRRYQEIGARIYQTGRQGALVWRSDAPDSVLRWREDFAPYWRSQEPAPGASKR